MASKESTIEDTRIKRGRPKGQATQLVYNALRGEILTLSLKPGQYLEETVLEKRFDVSRTPIREALIRLQSDRLVKFMPNRGHYVEIVSFDEIPKIFEALDLHQAAVFKLAAIRRTEKQLSELVSINESYRIAGEQNDHKVMAERNHDFHMAVGKAADNPFLSESYETMLNFSIRLSYLMFKSAGRDPEDSKIYYTQIYDEHRGMIEMIRNGEGDLLQEISRKHTKLFLDRVVSFLTQRVELDALVQNFADHMPEGDDYPSGASRA
ncbi:GntR family transcriptional regulator [Agrobacterium sp.]|jgi:DNA-binding GntR family transcriptional regulator|uniref:GntR family transcriptional regulator n=1 Tax=Agrobacterium sp. TaxID=361 RepID=UPI0028A69BAD|nr:GntR family transcriptional regulator [Agrobacterium sp.]